MTIELTFFAIALIWLAVTFLLGVLWGKLCKVMYEGKTGNGACNGNHRLNYDLRRDMFLPSNIFSCSMCLISPQDSNQRKFAPSYYKDSVVPYLVIDQSRQFCGMDPNPHSRYLTE